MVRNAYLARNFPGAIASFKAAKRIRPIDQAVNIHLMRSIITNGHPLLNLGMVFGQC